MPTARRPASVAVVAAALAPAASDAQPAASARFPVRYDPAVSAEVRAAFLSAERARPQPVFDGPAVARLLADRTVRDFDRAAEDLGLSSADLADVMAASLAQRYAMAQNPRASPGRAEAQGIRAQLVATGAVARVAGGSDADRQRLAERLALEYVKWDRFRNMAENMAKEQPGVGAAIKAAAAASTRALGVDPAAMTLTARGFVKGAPSAPAGPTPTTGGTIARVAIIARPNFGVGGSMVMNFEPYLLYADGRIVEGDADPRGRFKPDAGRWTMDGRAVDVAWDTGKRERWDRFGGGQQDWARPGPPGMRLDGAYRAVTGGGSAASGVTTMSTDELTFSRDGRFVLGRTNVGLAPNVTAVGTATGMRGRYAIDGWSITLSYDDGRREQGLFYVFPNGPDGIGIGTPAGVRTFTKQDR